MSDVNKLKTVISSLEDQAEKVKEFSGVLSAVDKARKEIDETKGVLKENAKDSKQLLDDSQKSFNQLNSRMTSLEERLGKVERDQVQLRELIGSLDIASPRDLLNLKEEIGLIASDHSEGLKRQIEMAISNSNQKLSSKITTALLISGVAVLGIGSLYMKLVMEL